MTEENPFKIRLPDELEDHKAEVEKAQEELANKVKEALGKLDFSKFLPQDFILPEIEDTGPKVVGRCSCGGDLLENFIYDHTNITFGGPINYNIDGCYCLSCGLLYKFPPKEKEVDCSVKLDLPKICFFNDCNAYHELADGLNDIIIGQEIKAEDLGNIGRDRYMAIFYINKDEKYEKLLKEARKIIGE